MKFPFYASAAGVNHAAAVFVRAHRIVRNGIDVRHLGKDDLHLRGKADEQAAVLPGYGHLGPEARAAGTALRTACGAGGERKLGTPCPRSPCLRWRRF